MAVERHDVLRSKASPVLRRGLSLAMGCLAKLLGIFYTKQKSRLLYECMQYQEMTSTIHMKIFILIQLFVGLCK